MGQPTSIDDPVLSEKILSIATIYEKLLSIYSNKEVCYLKDSPLRGRKSLDWKKAVEMADELGIDYTFFVKANFYWFHEWFRTAPKPFQLATVKSLDRVKRYKNLVERGYVNFDADIRGVVHPEDNKLRPAFGYKREITTAVIAQNERLMKQLMAAHPLLNEHNVLQIFKNTFNQSWLENKLKEQK